MNTFFIEEFTGTRNINSRIYNFKLMCLQFRQINGYCSVLSLHEYFFAVSSKDIIYINIDLINN